MQNIIETPRLIIRKFTKDDAHALKIILGDPEVMRYSLKGALDEEGIREYLRTIILDHYEKHGFGLWAVVHKEDDQLIGYAGLICQTIDKEECVELGYRLATAYWGKGLAQEAAAAIRDFVFTEMGLDRLISIIDPCNVRSVRVAKKAGMERVKSTVFHGTDVDIYEIPNRKRL